MVAALLSMTVLGGFLALALAYSSRRFAVETDSRFDAVLEALPGANCGGCGHPGCAGYAEAVVFKNADPSLCAPGGVECALALARIIGAAVARKARLVSLCHCQKTDVRTAAVYSGIQTCRGASLFGLGGGWLDCRYGCLGYGDCLKVCGFGAIVMGGDGRPFVDESRCSGCRKCAVACPRGLMAVDGSDRHVHVRCRNRDKGPMANKICARACIVCGKCVKACPSEAIKTPNFLAEIDYSKCVNCGKCVEVCPHRVIADLGAERGGKSAETA